MANMAWSEYTVSKVRRSYILFAFGKKTRGSKGMPRKNTNEKRATSALEGSPKDILYEFYSGSFTHFSGVISLMIPLQILLFAISRRPSAILWVSIPSLA